MLLSAATQRMPALSHPCSPLPPPPPTRSCPFPLTQTKLPNIQRALPLTFEALVVEFDVAVDTACDEVVSKAFGTLSTVAGLRSKAAAGFRKAFPDLRSANERATAEFIRPLLAKAVAVFERRVKEVVGVLPVDEALIKAADVNSAQQGMDELGPVGTRLGQVALKTVMEQVRRASCRK